jgi:hypothetical protein
MIDFLHLDRTPRHGDPARTWRYKLNQWMDAFMVAGLAGLYILLMYLKRIGMQERNLTYAVSRIHFSLLIL